MLVYRPPFSASRTIAEKHASTHARCIALLRQLEEREGCGITGPPPMQPCDPSQSPFLQGGVNKRQVNQVENDIGKDERRLEWLSRLRKRR